MVSFLVITLHCGEYDVYIFAMNWLKYIQVWFSSLACKCVTCIMMPMGAKYFFRDLLEHLLLGQKFCVSRRVAEQRRHILRGHHPSEVD